MFRTNDAVLELGVLGRFRNDFWLISNAMKKIVISVLFGLIGSSIAMASQPTKGDQPVEDVVTLSSVQFATHFELVKQMLESEWDEKVYQHFHTTMVSSTR